MLFRSAGDDRLSEDRVALLALDRLVDVAGDRDGSVGAWHLQLQIRVAGTRHKFCKGGSAEDGVVGALEVHHLEANFFEAKFFVFAEDDVEDDPTHGVSLPSRDDAVEGGDGGLQCRVTELHPSKGLVVEDVDAAPSVHEGLGEDVALNLRSDYQGKFARVMDSRRVVLAGPGNHLIRPV